MLRIDLLRHLNAPETPAPKPPRDRRGMFKRGGGALAILLLAAAIGGLVKNPAWILGPLEAIRDRVTVKKTAPPDADSLRQALEAQASRLVASQQAAAISWLREMEAAIPADSLPGIRVERAVFTAPGTFSLRGAAAGEEDLSRLQESLVLVPGLDLRESRSRVLDGARGNLEFLFSGTFTAPVARDSTVAGRVVPRAGLEIEARRFLEAATFAGIDFTQAPAAPPTAAGALEAHPYRLTAACDPALLRAFLEGEYQQGSPFGVRRILLENAPKNTSIPATVFLDIMAFSH